jgi:PAS domain S-box-containing protein
MEWVHCHIARQPVLPSKRLNHVPPSVSAIIMKLLAKTAEERYQTAAGVRSDLRRCLTEWETRCGIDEFPLGEHDTPDRLLIPEKLYGRAREIDTLLASFDRVVASGAPELVLVSGYSGIGKSSVVNELHKVLVLPRGLFASGKFDQYKRDIPYWTLAQAFQGLIRPLLGKSDAELSHWRGTLQEALGPNGQLIVDLVPELALILGEQQPVPELSPQDAQRRFQLVFRRFIGVFARPEHPLALFLDDLQWLDAATLDLLEDMLTQPDMQHLLLIGAYRDNEVNATHPLIRKLEAIRGAGALVQEITLAPLAHEDLEELLADSLRCASERAAPLALLLHEKTGGNPFFAIQFISALAEEGLLTFDHATARWSWDLARIHAKGYTDNVVDLMVGRLHRLTGKTQQALQLLACLGNVAEIATLCIARGTSEPELHADLWEAVRQELIISSEGTYKFVHDRVQEAAYSLIPKELRAQAHLRIGRLLLSRTAPEEMEGKIFEVVNQLNRGTDLTDSLEERERIAELNLIAGKRAKTSTAYASALTYFVAGRALLPEESWKQRYALIFALEFQRAEGEFLTGDFTAAEKRLWMLSRRAEDLVDSAVVARLQTDLYTALDQSDRAVGVSIEYLRRAGVDWSPHPTNDEVRQEYERIWQQLGNRPIEALIDLPPMTDPACRATLDVLTVVEGPAFFTDQNLRCLVVARMVNLSLEHGNSDGSCVAYVQLGWFVGPRFGDYQAAFRFGKLALDLVEKRGLERFRTRVSQIFGYFINPWSRHLRSSLELFRRSFTTAREAGDLKYAAYSWDRLVTFLLAAGEPLGDVQREAEHGLEFTRTTKFAYVVDIIIGQLRFIQTLRGLTPSFSSFDDAEFDEGQFEQYLEADPHLVFARCWYWIRKLQARFYAGDYAAALAAASMAEPLLQTGPGHFEWAEYIFYGALARAAEYDSASSEKHVRYRETLFACHKQIVAWAENCPENFETRVALVGAEIARIEGRELDAERLYEQAIRSAHVNGFVHNEALANELAARFYAARGFEKIAHTFWRDARYCYLRWGAGGKVRQLDELYPYLREAEPAPGPTSTIGASVEHLDFAGLIKVSQALSGEIVLEKLIETLMRTAIEHAGAERGLLILPRGVTHQIEAEATTSSDTVIVVLREACVTEGVLPESIVHYVVRTQESVILDDASTPNPFSEDSYIRRQHARSILCLPLINQAKLIGLLYLENHLTPHVFTPTRIAVLKLLASQAAISLENSRLYRDLQEREAKIRRLVDSNIMGIFIWNLQGEIIEANEAFLSMVQYSREDLVLGRVRWTDLTPEEWRDRDERAVAEAKATGTVHPGEKEYFRKDGSRVPVLVGAAIFEGSRHEGVAFVLDLSEQKRAENERKRAEEAVQKAQAELAHITRVAALGELTASIAHEISQPLAAVVTNANASLRWLSRDSPNLAEACEAIHRIIRDGNRAGEVISRTRALFKKADTTKERLDLNETIKEVMILAQSEVQRNRVSLQTQLADDLPPIMGDRTQVQQVMLNLLINAIEAMSGVGEGPRELWLSSEKFIEVAGESEGTGAARTLAAAEWTHVLITVRDSGPGVDPKSLDRLFDAFYTTKPQGMGMGLAISRSIIEAHGGRLWAKANPSRGAVFRFTLPIRERSWS